MRPSIPNLLATLSACALLSSALSAQDDPRVRNDSAWRGISQSAAVVKQIQGIGSEIVQMRALGNRRGARLIFSGPNSTDKSLAARALGRRLDREVYRVDLSSVTSKYLGETEKNLSRIFSNAESKDWILFFDEADALFGKRTAVSDAHQRFADQDVAYLLKRIEAYPGIVIITSNDSETSNKIRHDRIVEFAPPARLPRPPGTR